MCDRRENVEQTGQPPATSLLAPTPSKNAFERAANDRPCHALFLIYCIGARKEPLFGLNIYVPAAAADAVRPTEHSRR